MMPEFISCELFRLRSPRTCRCMEYFDQRRCLDPSCTCECRIENAELASWDSTQGGEKYGAPKRCEREVVDG